MTQLDRHLRRGIQLRQRPGPGRLGKAPGVVVQPLGRGRAAVPGSGAVDVDGAAAAAGLGGVALAGHVAHRGVRRDEGRALDGAVAPALATVLDAVEGVVGAGGGAGLDGQGVVGEDEVLQGTAAGAFDVAAEGGGAGGGVGGGGCCVRGGGGGIVG